MSILFMWMFQVSQMNILELRIHKQFLVKMLQVEQEN